MIRKVPVVPVKGAGIRLYPGDALIFSRRYGTRHAELLNAFNLSPILLTITGTDETEEAAADSYVRLHFSLPDGIHYITHRQGEDGDVEAKIQSSMVETEHVLDVMGAVRIFPVEEKGMQACQTLSEEPIVVEAFETTEGGDAKIRIFAGLSWKSLLAKDDEVPIAPSVEEKSTRLPARSAASDAEAFLYAAQKMLSDESLEEIWAVAKVYQARRPSP